MIKSIKGKYFIHVTIAAALVSVAALVYLLAGLFSKEDNQVIDLKSMVAIPSDVSSIFYFSSLDALNRNISANNPLFGDLFFGNGHLRPFIERVYNLSSQQSLKEMRSKSATISAHYSAKNDVDPILALKIDTLDVAFLIESLSTGERIYSGTNIYSSGRIEFSVCNGFFLASPSPIILESSVRHLLSGTSIADNEVFAALVSKTYVSDLVAFINHSQTGKLFSGYVKREFLGYSDFISNFSNWSVFHFSNSSEIVFAEGDFEFERGAAKYVSVFSGMDESAVSVGSVLPYNTLSVLTLSVEDYVAFNKAFVDHKSFLRKRDYEIDEEALDWFSNEGIVEISIAHVPFAGLNDAVTILRRDQKRGNLLYSIFKGDDKELIPEEYIYKGFIGKMFGSFFDETNEESMLVADEWIFIGPEELLVEFGKGSFSSFTMESFLGQTKARNLSSDRGALLTLLLNGSFQPDSLTRFFKNNVSRGFEKMTNRNNLMLASFQILANKEGNIESRVFAYLDSLDKMPVAQAQQGAMPAGWENDTIVEIPKGPFQLLNHNTGEKEYLEQLPNLWLRLNDKNKKGIWSVPFEKELKGFVQQIDFYNNGKLQMLFADDQKIYLLDRTGRFVHPFPVKAAVGIELGPKVFDLESNGDVAIMILHTDNTLRLYDRMLKPYPVWNNITVDETIKEFPELIELGANKYWVLRSSAATYIFTVNGNVVGNLSGKSRLRYDTQVIFAGGSLVKVTTVENKELLLNLETGKHSRIR
jgi:hypothetical protein